VQSAMIGEYLLGLLTLFGACAVSLMMLSYALEARSAWWVLVFAFASVASSTYGWLAGTWPFGVVEAVWALIAVRRWWLRRKLGGAQSSSLEQKQGHSH
jgi:hypothetical protein